MSDVFTIKRGDSVTLLCRLKNDDGTPESIANVDIASQVRNSRRELIDTFTVNKLEDALQPDTTGLYELVILDTSDWPTKTLMFDIKYSVSGKVTRTDTLNIECVDGVTE
jgi:hypothetical protein